MKHLMLASAVLVLTLIVAGPAGAAKGSFFISAKAMAPLNAATAGANLIAIPDTPGGSFHFNINLPADYKDDTEVNVRLRMRQIGPACVVKFSTLPHTRSRIGRPYAVYTTGITMLNGLTVALGNHVSNSKTFKITGRNSGAVRGLKAGDIIVPEFSRDAGSADDTCTTQLLLDGAEVIYRKK